MSKINHIIRNIIVLNTAQKKRFLKCLPSKVYATERNISIIVALTQIIMICVFLFGREDALNNVRGVQYFSLYCFLLISTISALLLYRYTRRNSKMKLFFLTRKIYAALLCIWVLCVTALEVSSGKGMTVYCYLMPTMAALLLLSPIESLVIYGGSWIGLMILFLMDNHTYLFANSINSIFVSVLTLFISIRYYHSMAVEFLDRETINSQYQKIEDANQLLQKMAQKDQLTQLYNRHYLLENIYPLFDKYKESHDGMFVMLDIDYFKQYNDRNGHVEGDECLKKLAQVFAKVSEKHGISPIRYGGEEFLFIKMSEEKIDAHFLVQEILTYINQANIKRDDVEFDRVTVSVGLWNGSLSTIPHIEKAIKMADDALYKAKLKGRNTVVEVNTNEE